MICHRCQGLMVEEELRDWGGGRGHDCSDSWRCVVCGEVVDPVITINRSEVKKVSVESRKKHARRSARTIPVLSR
jgi:hypothetical protein